MNRQCLICDSSAVLTRDAAKGLTLLAGLLNGAIKGARRPGEGGCHADLLGGLAAVAPAYPEARRPQRTSCGFTSPASTACAYAAVLCSTRQQKARRALAPAEALHQTLHKLQYQRTIIRVQRGQQPL